MTSQIKGELRTRINRQLELQQFQSPLIEDATLPSEHQGMLAGLRERAASRIAEVTAEDERRPNIYFDFVEDARFNAVAMAIDSDYLIVMTSRALVDIPGVFRRLFALPQFAPHIGDPSKEKQFGVPYVPIDAPTMNLIDLLPYPERLPNCPQRGVVATRCSQIAFDFLLLHEIGHLRSGHLPYLFRGKPGQLAEADSVAKATADVVARHTFEMDADFACRRAQCEQHAFLDRAHMAGRASQGAGKAVRHGRGSILQLLPRDLRPVPLLWPVLMDCRNDMGPKPSAAGDPAIHASRSCRGTSRARQCARRERLIPAVKLYQITMNVIREVEKGLSQLTGVWVPPRLGDAARTWLTYGKKLNEYWIKAYPEPRQAEARWAACTSGALERVRAKRLREVELISAD